MKILMILEGNFPPDTRVENEVKALIEAGHEVHMACLKTKKDQREREFGELIIHRYSIGEFIRKSSVGVLSFPNYFIFWRKRVDALFEEHHFDVVHIHDLQLAKIGHEMKQKYGARFILDLHENWPALLSISEHTKSFLGKLFFSLKKWRKYEKKYCNLADDVIVVVDESKDRIASLGVDRDRIHVISNTLNLDEFNFEVYPGNTEKTIFTYAGGVTFHRGLQYVLEAVALIGAELKYEVWIIGNGRYLKTLKEKSKDLNIEDKISFFGWQDRNKLLQLVCKSDVNLIPHIKSEHTDTTIPHKIFQYLYAEKPILASNCDPIERIIKEANGGWIYQYDGAKELSEVMEKIIQKELDIIGKSKGKELVQNKYNWSVDKKKLVNIYGQ